MPFPKGGHHTSETREKIKIATLAKSSLIVDSNKRRRGQKLNVNRHGERNANWRGGGNIFVCPVCNRFFSSTRPGRKPKYCSRSCMNIGRPAEKMFTRCRGGKRADLNNTYFRSSYEANYARYLNFLIKHEKRIKKWEYEAEHFRFNKISRGTVSYTPDFKVTFTDGHVEYHEVKGWDYPKGITARKRMAKYYPKVELFLVDQDFFRTLKRQGFDKLIPGWE